MASRTGPPNERSEVGPGTSGCEQEPIHIPGSIQPHGVLLVLDPDDLKLVQVSENVGELLGVPAAEALGRPLARVLGGDAARGLAAELARAPTRTRPASLRSLSVTAHGAPRTFSALAHRTDGGIVLELEQAPATPDSDAEMVSVLHALVDRFTLQAEAASTIEALCRMTCEEVRQITGFDRVLLYRFDEGWDGVVLGESGNGRLPSYLHHRFPAADIPAQARELYRLSRLRIIPDSSFRPVPVTPTVNPATQGPLDMSFAALRSVSPVHVEYMRNMDTAASMSASILREGKLWGLVSCHHKDPRFVPYAIRSTCDLLARAFSLRLSALEHTRDFQRHIEVRSAYSKLLSVMADHGDFVAALCEHPDDLIGFVDARGAAVLTEGGCRLLGDTPTEAQVRALADWLFHTVGKDIYSTDSLPGAYPAASAYAHAASGLLAIAVSKLHPSYVLWFRPEVVRTIQWGGDPVKPDDDRTGMHPRKSFATWRETVKDCSVPWRASELEGAAELRNTIVGTVLRKAEELAELNAELTRSNKELEAFSYSVSHDLRAPLRHIAGYAEMLRESAEGRLTANDERCVATIISSCEYAGQLVDKLLAYSRLGRAELQRSRIDLNVLVQEVRADVMRDAAGRDVRWQIARLPTVSGDLMMLRMAVRDLLANAVKYTRRSDPATIEVGWRDAGVEHEVYVRDNGVGFDMQYVNKLFGVFERLHKWEDYEGTGIGLANVRRVIERHGGRTWAFGEENRGATFHFTLPKAPERATRRP